MVIPHVCWCIVGFSICKRVAKVQTEGLSNAHINTLVITSRSTVVQESAEHIITYL